jgi:hypothetical protein
MLKGCKSVFGLCSPFAQHTEEREPGLLWEEKRAFAAGATDGEEFANRNPGPLPKRMHEVAVDIPLRD